VEHYALQVVIASQRPAVPASGENLFVSFAQNALMLWTLLVLPLHGALVAALVAMIDHEQNHWKQLLAQPVSLRRLILAKWVVLFLLLLTSVLVLLAGILGLEEGLSWTRPGWRAATPRSLMFSGSLLTALSRTVIVTVVTPSGHSPRLAEPR
jgi:hypothetical protein